ncbi:Multicopper oxidase type 2 [Penicillium canescens]|nr:Multicopper oxidase type 2 [Penicillium canescens]
MAEALLLLSCPWTTELSSLILPSPPPKSVDQLVSLTIGRVDSAYMWSTFGGGLYDMITK